MKLDFRFLDWLSNDNPIKPQVLDWLPLDNHMHCLILEWLSNDYPVTMREWLLNNYQNDDHFQDGLMNDNPSNVPDWLSKNTHSSNKNFAGLANDKCINCRHSNASVNLHKIIWIFEELISHQRCGKLCGYNINSPVQGGLSNDRRSSLSQPYCCQHHCKWWFGKR